MKQVGRRQERPIQLQAEGALLREGARFSETVSHLCKSTFIPKGVYRYRSHDEANKHQDECLAQGMSRLASERG